MKCWATKTLLREEGKQSAYFFFWRGFARERRRPREMSSFEKSIWNSLTTPEQEQETCRVCVPMLGQPTAWTALLLDLQEHVKDKCCWTHCLNGLDVDFFLPQEQSAQVWQRCRWRPGAPSKENGHHVTVVLLRCFLLLPYHRTSQPESPVSSVPCTTCGRRGASKEKKSVGSWFVAESAPLGGEL